MATPVHSLSYGSRIVPETLVPSSSAKQQTYFSKSDVQFPPLTENGDIETAGFLNASKGIAEFVSFLGKAFSPVKEDIKGNISKVDRVYQTDREKYATVRKLLDAEIVDWPNRMGPATEALLWLKRGLEFIYVFLELVVSDHNNGKKGNSLTPMGHEAYEKTLKKHHKTIERGLFKIIIHATPYRKDFMKKLACGGTVTEEECVLDMSSYQQQMKANVDNVVAMYKELGFEK